MIEEVLSARVIIRLASDRVGQPSRRQSRPLYYCSQKTATVTCLNPLRLIKALMKAHHTQNVLSLNMKAVR